MTIGFASIRPPSPLFAGVASCGQLVDADDDHKTVCRSGLPLLQVNVYLGMAPVDPLRAWYCQAHALEGVQRIVSVLDVEALNTRDSAELGMFAASGLFYP